MADVCVVFEVLFNDRYRQALPKCLRSSIKLLQPYEKQIWGPKMSLFGSIAFYLQLHCIKFIVKWSYRISNLFRPPPVSQRPSILRVYPSRPHLQHRVFIPPCYSAESEHLPVYVSIHGGGFAICKPEFDDEFCSDFAAQHGIIVVSLDYSKSPKHQFPTAVYDIVAGVDSLLTDESLPIDPSRVAIGGFSAGGCLALAAAQVDGIREKLQGVVAWYPVLDFTTPMTQKLERRAYGFEGQTDGLAGIWDSLEWGYLRSLSHNDRENPLISPKFASRSSLPPFLYLIGAEWDALAPETREMASILAGQKIAENCYSIDEGGSRLRWEEVRGVEHAFTHVKGRKEVEVGRIKARDDLYRGVGDWLNSGPLKR